MTAASNIRASTMYGEHSLFQSLSTSSNNFCLPKYNNQRDDIPTIPKDTVEKLFVSMDYDMDGHISLEEFQRFAHKSKLALLTPETVNEMFYEITERRGIAHNHQLNSPFILDELYLCCKLILNI